MIDVSTLIWSILGFSTFNLVFGYVLGHYGLTAVKNELVTIKDLISGQEKITVAPVVVTPTQPTQPVV